MDGRVKHGHDGGCIIRLSGQDHIIGEKQALFRVPTIIILPRRWPASRKTLPDLRVLFSPWKPAAFRLRARDRPRGFAPPRASLPGGERTLILDAVMAVGALLGPTSDAVGAQEEGFQAGDAYRRLSRDAQAYGAAAAGVRNTANPQRLGGP